MKWTGHRFFLFSRSSPFLFCVWCSLFIEGRFLVRDKRVRIFIFKGVGVCWVRVQGWGWWWKERRRRLGRLNTNDVCQFRLLPVANDKFRRSAEAHQPWSSALPRMHLPLSFSYYVRISVMLFFIFPIRRTAKSSHCIYASIAFHFYTIWTDPMIEFSIRFRCFVLCFFFLLEETKETNWREWISAVADQPRLEAVKTTT